jgi:hypothetical protein
MKFDVPFLSVIAFSVLPLVTGIVTQQVATGRLKALVLAVLSAVTAVVTAVIEDEGVLTAETGTLFVVGLVIAAGIYFGFWKPTGVAPAVQSATPNLGVSDR